MPACLSDGRGTGAGFRKPPGKEPAGWRARFRRYGDLAFVLGLPRPSSCGWRMAMMLLTGKRASPVPRIEDFVDLRT